MMEKLLDLIDPDYVLALIPARGGSKSVPKKNIRKFRDHPLIAYTIAACALAERVDRVVVSTDSEEIREQTLAQMATVWNLRNTLTSVILGASRASQIRENVAALKNRDFTQDELNRIDRILKA